MFLLLANGPAATPAIGDVRSSVAEGRVKSGTGFFVAPDGLLVTSAHVVAGCSGITLWPAIGAERTGRIVALEPALDLALLSSEGEVPRYAAGSGQFAAPRPGDRVATIGFGAQPSRPREAKVTSGSLIGDVPDAAGNRLLLIRARLREGNSGGPVIDARGSLIGVVRGRDTERPEVGIATPAEAIDWFLQRHGIAPASTAPGAEQLQDPADLLRAISVLVQCAPRYHASMPGRQCLLGTRAAQVPQGDRPVLRL